MGINTNNSFCTLGAWRYSDQFSTLGADKTTSAFGAYTSFAQSASLDHLGTWIRLGWANPSVHEMKHHLSAGVSAMRAIGDREIEYGAAIAQGTSSSYLSQGINIESQNETALELTLKVPVMPHVTVQPDIQWIKSPGFNPTINEAWVLGLRFQFEA